MNNPGLPRSGSRSCCAVTMRSTRALFLLTVCALTAHYIYTPIPENMEQRWKLMLTDCFFRSLGHLADLSEMLGLKDYMGVMLFITVAEHVDTVSDGRVKVEHELFDGVEVLVYRPRRDGPGGGRRRAVIYLHGGGWCLGSSKMGPYDLLARRMVTELDAVVISVEYRLAPAHHFPVPFEDVYRVVKYFLRADVLDGFAVDPGRVAVSGDSAGGNLAAAVAQQLQVDPDRRVPLKVQALIYPVTQALDLNTPSYQQNRDMPILPRRLMVRFWSEYFTTDRWLFDAMLANRHNGPESAPLLRFVNWSESLPDPYRGAHGYSAPPVSAPEPSHPFTDPRASPLLVPDALLRGLPRTYVLTCEYDVLRDDGVMYATRLRQAGVRVTHQHVADGFHGALMFTVWPVEFHIAHRLTNSYLLWLKENL